MASTATLKLTKLFRIYGPQTLQNSSKHIGLCSVGPIQNRNINISVSPQDALLDNPPLIQVDGLNKNQNVTLWNTFTDDSGFQFSSHAHYIASENGIVDVRKDVSHGGKYKGIFTEGLVSSLHSAPPVYRERPHLKWARLFKKDVTKPMKYTLNVVDGHVSEKQLYSDTKPPSIGETEFLRHLMADGVRRVEIDENGIQGVLFLPPGKGPFPVVLDLFGAESGIKEFRSAMLASYGYASFVAPYYNYKDLPPLSDRIDLDYFLKIIDYLDSLPESNSGRIGIIGSSKGGEIGLTLCSLSDKIKACVAINAYIKSIDIDYYLNNKILLEKLTPDSKSANISLNKRGQLVAYGKSWIFNWDLPGILPVEKASDDCRVLIAAGDEDGGHGHKCGLTLRERARHFDRENVSIVIYPGSGHLMDPPFHSHIEAVWNTTILVREKDDKTRHKGLPHYYGGNPYSVCQATKDLWKRTLAMFHLSLVQEAGLPIHKTKLYPPY